MQNAFSFLTLISGKILSTNRLKIDRVEADFPIHEKEFWKVKYIFFKLQNIFLEIHMK